LFLEQRDYTIRSIACASEQHLFHVTMTIPDVTGEVIVQMPAWNALYQIRDFSHHVQQVEAFAGSEMAPVEKTRQANLARPGERYDQDSVRYLLG